MLFASELALVAGAHRHGPYELSSAELEARVPGLSPGWSEKYLGMTGRRVLPEGEHIASLGIAAVQGAVSDAGWAPGDVQGLVCGTAFMDQVLPPTGAVISQAVNPAAVAFDVNAACAAFPYALTVAASLMTTDPRLERMVVCVAEHPTVWVDYTDPHSCAFWGDSAGAVALTRGRPSGSFRLVGAELANDSEFPTRVHVPRDGTFSHDGRYSYQQVLRLTEHVVTTLLGDAGVKVGELRAFVGHQSNTRLLTDLSDRLDIPLERQWSNVAWAGNQSGAGSLTAFSGGWAENRADLADGDLVVVGAVGAGYTAGAVLLEWVG